MASAVLTSSRRSRLITTRCSVASRVEDSASLRRREVIGAVRQWQHEYVRAAAKRIDTE
jgi:hypothetical protein